MEGNPQQQWTPSGSRKGSVFGPIGYTIYSLPISDIAKSHNVSYHTYAWRYTALSHIWSQGIKWSGNSIENSFSMLSWTSKPGCAGINSKLNEGKTEFLVVGSPQNIRNLNNVCLNLGTTKIIPSTSMKNLGVYFDSSMSMSDPNFITFVNLFGFS